LELRKLSNIDSANDYTAIDYYFKVRKARSTSHSCLNPTRPFSFWGFRKMSGRKPPKDLNVTEYAVGG